MGKPIGQIKNGKKVKETIHAFNSKYHNVRVIFQGHEHLFLGKRINGIDYVITGDAGAPLDGEPQNGGFYHFLLAGVDGTHVKIDVFLPNYFSVNYEYSSPDSDVATAMIENRLPPVYNGLKINGLRFVMPKASSYELNSDIPCSILKITPAEDGKNVVWVQASLKFPHTNVESLLKATVLMFTKKTTQKLFRSTSYYVSVKAIKGK